MQDINNELLKNKTSYFHFLVTVDKLDLCTNSFSSCFHVAFNTSFLPYTEANTTNNFHLFVSASNHLLTVL